MNNEERNLIEGLFTRLRQAEAEGAPRDAEAQGHIAGLVQQHAAAPYYMAQAILVQEAALKRLDEQNRQLQAELAEAKAKAANVAPAQQGGGGFLSSIFGSSARPAPSQPAAAPVAPPPSSGGGWRDGPGVAPQSNWGAPPPQAQAAPARSGASSFLGGALQTAAGVAGGVMLAQGISSLFHHNSQPEEIVEVIKEEPSQVSDQGGWNDDSQRYVADNSNGYSDSGYSDDGGGFFSDDDYV
ncbi:DUF2076 domain-containing protein [Pseudomonas wadenswilerensis]